MTHAKVGPTRPPFTGYSLKPPGNMSMSSGLAYINLNLAITSGDISLLKSSQVFARCKPHLTLNMLYEGTPWSRPKFLNHNG